MATTTIESGPAASPTQTVPAPVQAPIPVSDSGPDRNPEAPNAPTRASAPPSARARASTIQYKTKAMTGVRRFTGGAVFDSRPETIREVFARTRAGGWMPGDRAKWLEAIGKVYGFAVAIPVTGLAYIGVWTVQRPTRVIFMFILAAAVRWAL